MPFAESFVQCMQEQAGVTVDASVVTDQAHFTETVSYVKQWYDSFSEAAKTPLEAASSEGEVAKFLVEANIAPGLDGLMAVFDQLVGWPLSTLLQWCEYCGQAAAQESPATP